VSTQDSNEILDFALNHSFDPWVVESGLDKVVAQGDHSHKCPVYTKRVPPCTDQCPAGEDIRGYHNILRGIEPSENKWEDAWRLITDKNPFPSVMGRICPAPCEGGCNRQYLDETVGINSVEHAVGQYAIDNNLAYKKPEKETGKHIAVVGAGPAGLSAAYQLRRKGHAVTIFDAQQKTGGMMRYGVMGYRVDRKILDAEIDRILDMGVTFKGGVRIGKDITLEQLEADYDAVFLGIGAQKGRMLPIPGFEASPYVTNSIEFLMRYEANPEGMKIGKKVVVLGDGDVAMDAARLSLRLGAEVELLSAVERDDMNCSAYEYDEAVHEGTKPQFAVSVTEVIRDGENVKGVKCVKMVKKEKGEENWNSPIPFMRYKPQAGSEFTVECDMVIASIGQTTDTNGFENIAGDSPFFKVDHNYQVKGKEKVFAGGDIIKIHLITTAVGHGRKAAHAIDQMIAGKPLPGKERNEVVTYEMMHPYYYKKSPKAERKHNPATNVKGNFDEILQVLEQTDTEAESARCLSCGLCFSCKQCLLYCPQEAISYTKTNPVGETMYTDYKKCVGCHICSEVCPCGYIDMGMGEDL